MDVTGPLFRYTGIVLGRHKGPAWEFMRLLRKSKPCKGSQFKYRATGKQPDRVVIGIGQIHPVLKGHFVGRYAKQIARAQAAVFTVCHYLYKKGGITSFGQEGFSVTAGRAVEKRIDADVIQDLMKDVYGHKGPKKILLKLSKKWRKALRKKDQEEVIRTATALNALTLLQAVEEKVTVFPIESREVHSAISDELNALHDETEKIRTSAAFQSARKKNGKELTKEEYDAVMKHNKLAKQFETLIRSAKRDEAILSNVLQYSEGKHVTVFVLGQGHKKAMLRLAKKTCPPEVLFVWMTVKPLRKLRMTLLRYIGVFVGLIILVAILNEVA